MKQTKGKNILAIMACLLMIMPPTGFADDGTKWGSTPTQAYNREGPALSLSDTSQSTHSSQTKLPVVEQNLLLNPATDFPLSSPGDKTNETPPALTEDEALQVLRLLSEALAMARNSQDLTASDAEKYDQAHGILEKFLKSKKPVGSKGTGGMDTALEVLRAIDGILGQGVPSAPALGTSPSLSPSENMIRQFTGYIVSSIQTTREYMRVDVSLPEAAVFSAEEAPEVVRETRIISSQGFSPSPQINDQTPGSAVLHQEITDTYESSNLLTKNAASPEAIGRLTGERAVLSRGLNRSGAKDYQVISSVVLSREIAKTHELLNPPQKLHPFLRWLLYGRHLTRDRAERYLAARAKIQAIFLRAKAGEGLIRYKGKIMGVFLPLPGDESGGAFELVRRM